MLRCLPLFLLRVAPEGRGADAALILSLSKGEGGMKGLQRQAWVRAFTPALRQAQDEGEGKGTLCAGRG